jgi:hypothetical protein
MVRRPYRFTVTCGERDQNEPGHGEPEDCFVKRPSIVEQRPVLMNLDKIKCAFGGSRNSAVPESDPPRAWVRLLPAPLEFAMLEVYP